MIADNLPEPRSAGLEHVGEVVRRTHTDLLTAIREEQARLGRHMTDSELEEFARTFYAPEYRAEMRRLMAIGVEVSDEQER